MQPFIRVMGLVVLVAVLLATSEEQSFARGTGGAGPGAFSGELRGVYQVRGKVLCVGCSVQDVQKASPTHLHDLYTLKNKGQHIVFQITQLQNTASGRESLLGRWEAITGVTRQLSLRAEDGVWQTLIAPENQRQELQLTGLLQHTGTFDVAEITLLY